MRPVTVKCVHDGRDELTVAGTGGYKDSIVKMEGSEQSYWLLPDDARKVRDAITAALDAHDDKQRERRARWEKAWELEYFDCSPSGRIGICGCIGGQGLTNILAGNGRNGSTIECKTLDEVIAKLTAIRDAHRECQETEGTR